MPHVCLRCINPSAILSLSVWKLLSASAATLCYALLHVTPCFQRRALVSVYAKLTFPLSLPLSLTLPASLFHLEGLVLMLCKFPNCYYATLTGLTMQHLSLLFLLSLFPLPWREIRGSVRERKGWK